MRNPFLIIAVLAALNSSAMFGQDVASISTKTSFEKDLPNVTEKEVSVRFEVYNIIPEEIKKVNDEMAGTHFLGNEIAKKIYLFEQAYTYTVAISPGNPAQKTMFRKPLIYNSVREIERLLRKSVKSGKMTMDEATGKFNKVLDVAINIKSTNTGKFEEIIKSKENSSDLLALYTQVNLNYVN